jgi:hypothetical protein
VQDGIGVIVGAIVGALERGTTPPRRSQTKGVRKRSAGNSGSRQLKLCLLERGKVGASKVFKKCSEIVSTENSSPCKNSFGKTIGVIKTALAEKRPVSSLGCARSSQGNSSAQVAAAARARSASLRRRWGLSTALFASG